MEGPKWDLFYTAEEIVEGEATAGDYIVEEIVKHRRTKDGKLEFLVKWEGFGKEECTWEKPSSFLPMYSQAWADYCQSHGLQVNLVDHLGEGVN